METILKPIGENSQFDYKLVHTSEIKEKLLCDCVDKFGQQYGCTNSGCYALDNDFSECRNDLLDALSKEYGIDVEEDGKTYEVDNERILFYDDEDIDIDVLREVNLFIAAWCEENEVHEGARCVTFFDGSEFKDLVIGYNGLADIEYIEVTNPLLLTEFKEAKFIDYKEGVCRSETEHFTFVHTLNGSSCGIDVLEKQI